MSLGPFSQLPLEILLGIFHYLDIPNILRIRRVSRYLNEVGHSRDVWTDAYRNADFVRPPGPFLSQSAHDLENTLAPSFRVDQNLLRGGDGTAQSEKPAIKLREIRHTGLALHVSLVFGRFLLIALREEVRCYDLNLDALDSNSGASIIYRSTNGTLLSLHCVSATDVDGRPFACVVLREAVQAERREQISIYSLIVAEQSELTLDLLHQFEHRMFDVGSVDLGPRVIVVQGRVGPAFHSDWRVVALDVHVRAQLLFPSPTGTMWETDKVPEGSTIPAFRSISTSTHLLLAMSLYTRAAGSHTIFQAFALPLPNTHKSFTHLSYSHQGIIPDIGLRKVVLLNDAVLDPSTQDTLITIRVDAFQRSRPSGHNSKYGHLRLCRSHPGEVGAIAFEPLGSFGLSSRIPFIHPSFNGTGRAFYALKPAPCGIIAALEYDVCGNNGPEAKIIEYPSILRFPTPRTLLDYDPYSGRMCLESPVARYTVIEIFDLAV